MLITTKRLKIRAFQASDWQDVLAYTSQEAVMHYLPEDVFTEEEAKQFVQKKDMFAVQYEDKVIGHISFIDYFGGHTYEVGWVFNPDYYHKGFATEAAQAVVDYGFATQKLHRIVATCQPENIGSYRIMEKIGMRREAFFKKCIPYKDEWWDEYYYAILAEEWAK